MYKSVSLLCKHTCDAITEQKPLLSAINKRLIDQDQLLEDQRQQIELQRQQMELQRQQLEDHRQQTDLVHKKKQVYQQQRHQSTIQQSVPTPPDTQVTVDPISLQDTPAVSSALI